MLIYGCLGLSERIKKVALSMFIFKTSSQWKVKYRSKCCPFPGGACGKTKVLHHSSKDLWFCQNCKAQKNWARSVLEAWLKHSEKPQHFLENDTDNLYRAMSKRKRCHKPRQI